MNLDAPVTGVNGVGPAISGFLRELGIYTVRDLLFHVPNRHEDRRERETFESIRGGESGIVLAEVTHIHARRIRGGRSVVEAKLKDETGTAKAIWFHQPYLVRSIAVGTRALFRGKVKRSANVEMLNPEFEVVRGDNRTKGFGKFDGLVPVYPGTGKINTSRLRKLIGEAVEEYGAQIPEILREKDLSFFNLPKIETTLRWFHQPTSGEELRSALCRLKMDEAYTLQVAIALLRQRQIQQQREGFSWSRTTLQEIARCFPFELTPGQKKAVKEILADLARGHPMHRLLQGDVGSGKTAVAAFAVAAVVLSGGQVAFMAPTEILAQQLNQVLSDVLAPLNLGRIELLTGAVKGRARSELLSRIEGQESSVVVGTHALLSPGLEFCNLRLAIVDEQHRFGVRQRLELRPDGSLVDLLVMSATPIPRSVALTLFGDLDHSVIKGKPGARPAVQTRYVPRDKISDLLIFVREKVEAGERVFVICPRVEEAEGSDLRAAVEVASRLSKGAFSGLSIGVLHGRLPDGEKRRIFEDFRRGNLSVLVSTVVVEVGVDVPEATLMIIVDAHQFGLAQLHQLRGRVGRGAKKSFCFLLSGSEDVDKERLLLMTRVSDGFEIAEEDLRLRGTGALLGLRQHGLSDQLFIDPIEDQELIAAARAHAFKRVEEDPGLQDPENQGLREAVVALAKRKGLGFLRVG